MPALKALYHSGMTSSSIAIILCTYNGERFLPQQLASFGRQTFSDWSLFVYDDGSTDKTAQLIDAFRATYPSNPVHWLPNPHKRGFAQNFLQGICHTPDTFDYYALSDQDDVWCEEKLARAVNYLNTVPAGVPAIYGARTTLVDENGQRIGLSRLFDKPPSFKNALVQSIAGGNTMVLNKAARALLLQADKHIHVESHDWFMYQLVTGAGGVLYYDAVPCMLYRQHGNNLIGSNLGFFARLSRMMNLFNGTFQSWNNGNLDALNKNKQLLTPQNRAVLALLIESRQKPLVSRFSSFLKLGLYRQQTVDNVALFLAWMLGRV